VRKGRMVVGSDVPINLGQENQLVAGAADLPGQIGQEAERGIHLRLAEATAEQNIAFGDSGGRGLGRGGIGSGRRCDSNGSENGAGISGIRGGREGAELLVAAEKEE